MDFFFQRGGILTADSGSPLVSANPVGGGLGQLLSPAFSDTRTSVRVYPVTFRNEHVDIAMQPLRFSCWPFYRPRSSL